MRIQKLGLFALVVLVAGSFAVAGETTPKIKPLLTQPGKLLLREDLDKPFSKDWRTKKGSWQVVDGAMKGAELTTDMHNAAARRELAFKAAVLQFDFKLDGAKALHLSINAEKGHLFRVIVNSKGFNIIKDATVKKVDKRETIVGREFEIKPGTWHTLSVECLGKEILASLDGKEVAFGSHSGLDVNKAVVGLIVTGESASFKNLRVWEASANPNWGGTKTRLLEKKSKPSGSPK